MTLPTKTIRDVTETLIDYRGKTPTKTAFGIKLITAKVISAKEVVGTRKGSLGCSEKNWS